MDKVKKEIHVIALVRIFSSFFFAVMLSSLVLYLHHSQFSTTRQSVEITGLFLALNYVLPLLCGYVGNHFFNFKSLFFTGLMIQAVGCLFLKTQEPFLFLSLAMVLMGRMVTSVGIIVFINHITQNNHDYRRTLIFWNYAAMSLGCLLGYPVAGMMGLHDHYTLLFKIMAVLPLVSALLVARFVNYTPGHRVKKNPLLLLSFFAAAFLLTFFILKYALVSHYLLLALPALGIVYFIAMLVRLKSVERFKLTALLFYVLVSILFWSIYMLLPTLMPLFIKDNVGTLHGFRLAPQWFDMIDALILMLTPPLLAKTLATLNRKYQLSVPTSVLFSLSLLCLAVGCFLFSSNFAGLSPLALVVIYIFAQSVGELFIGPEGYTLPAKLAPEKIREFATGAWVSTLGIASLMATFIGDHVIGSQDHIPVPLLKSMFHHLSFITFLGFILTLGLGLWMDRRIKRFSLG